MKLEKFDLEKALNGAKVVTRDGREVKELTKFEGLKDYPLVGVLDNQLQTWTTQGLISPHLGECRADLFLAVETKRVYVNVLQYANGDLWVGSQCFRAFESAQNFCKNNNGKFKKAYVKTIEITDEL
jgi:hypothetical protein